MSKENDIPDFLRIPAEERKATWEANPPKAAPRKGWRTPEQEAAEKARLQAIADAKRMRQCISKQKRTVRQETIEAQLEDRKAAAEGKTWDVRTARWIDPIEEALKPKGKEENKKMVQVVERTAAPRRRTTKETKEATGAGMFGFRADTNYFRLLEYLHGKLDEFVTLRSAAAAAYGTSGDVVKHERRVMAMLRKTQEKVLTKRRMAFVIKKERKEDAIYVGLFTK